MFKITALIKVVIMPMGEFKDCMEKNKGKENPKACCAEIMRKIEGKDFSFDSQKMEIKSDGKNYYFEVQPYGLCC